MEEAVDEELEEEEGVVPFFPEQTNFSDDSLVHESDESFTDEEHYVSKESKKPAQEDPDIKLLAEEFAMDLKEAAKVAVIPIRPPSAHTKTQRSISKLAEKFPSKVMLTHFTH